MVERLIKIEKGFKDVQNLVNSQKGKIWIMKQEIKEYEIIKSKIFFEYMIDI